MKGTAFRDGSVPSGRSPRSFRLVVRGSILAERDAKNAAHAAHAVDPWVLDACLIGPKPDELALHRDHVLRGDEGYGAAFLHRSIGFATPLGRNGSATFRPSPADAYAAYITSSTTRPVSPSEIGGSLPRTHRAKCRISCGKP